MLRILVTVVVKVHRDDAHDSITTITCIPVDSTNDEVIKAVSTAIDKATSNGNCYEVASVAHSILP